MNNNKITTILPDGTKKEFDVIATFKNDNTNKDYIMYTDNSVDEYNKMKIYASIYNPDTLEFLGEPSTKEEWNEIYRILDNILLNR